MADIIKYKSFKMKKVKEAIYYLYTVAKQVFDSIKVENIAPETYNNAYKSICFYIPIFNSGQIQDKQFL